MKFCALYGFTYQLIYHIIYLRNIESMNSYIYIYIFNNHNDVNKYRIRLYMKKVDHIILVRLKKLKSYLVKEKKVEIL